MMLNYRAPLVAGVLLAAGLAWWGTLEHRAQELRHRSELERFVDGALLALDASHNVLRPMAMRLGAERTEPGIRRRPGLPPGGRNNDLEPLEQVMSHMVETQPRIRWIAVVADGKVIARGGSPPSDVTVDRPRGERIDDGIFLAWRPLGAPAREPAGNRPLQRDGRQSGPVGPAGPADDSGSGARRVPDRLPLPPGAPIAVVALDAVLPPQALRHDTLQIVEKIGTASVGAIALLVAWVLGIRGRTLSTRLEAERVRRTHLEELSLAASGLAHETKNPLGIIRGLAQRMEQSPGLDDRQRSAARQILEESDRAVSRLGEFMSYARIRTPEPAPVDGPTILAKAASVLAADLESAGVTVEIDAADLTVLADEEMLLQILLNLMLNSLQASAEGRVITLRLEATGRLARLTVEDQGRGMEPELAARAFQPYVTGRSDGHGLGLAIVKRLVERQGWSIAMTSRPDAGTVVTVGGLQTVAGTAEEC